MSDDLIAFAVARLDEDASESAMPEMLWGETAADNDMDERRERALREVAFKRALLRLHQPEPFWGNNPLPLTERTSENAVMHYCECQCPDGVIEGTYPCETVRLLAAVWNDHPDYREEWKP
jgi:hypothetical protein